MDKLKLIHTEPGLESVDPGEVDPPIDQTEISGVRPCRHIRKPLYIANDYVFNLLEGHQVSAKDSTLFRCHLCEHPPFLSQKLWKGHLFLVHKVKRADVTRNKSVDTTGDNPVQIRMDFDGVFQLRY